MQHLPLEHRLHLLMCSAASTAHLHIRGRIVVVSGDLTQAACDMPGLHLLQSLGWQSITTGSAIGCPLSPTSTVPLAGQLVGPGMHYAVLCAAYEILNEMLIAILEMTYVRYNINNDDTYRENTVLKPQVWGILGYSSL